MKARELAAKLLENPDFDVAIGYDCCMIALVSELQLGELDDNDYDAGKLCTPNTVVLWDYKPEGMYD